MESPIGAGFQTERRRTHQRRGRASAQLKPDQRERVPALSGMLERKAVPILNEKQLFRASEQPRTHDIGKRAEMLGTGQPIATGIYWHKPLSGTPHLKLVSSTQRPKPIPRTEHHQPISDTQSYKQISDARHRKRMADNQQPERVPAIIGDQ